MLLFEHNSATAVVSIFSDSSVLLNCQVSPRAILKDSWQQVRLSRSFIQDNSFMSLTMRRDRLIRSVDWCRQCIPYSAELRLAEGINYFYSTVCCRRGFRIFCRINFLGQELNQLLLCLSSHIKKTSSDENRWKYFVSTLRHMLWYNRAQARFYTKSLFIMPSVIVWVNTQKLHVTS